MSDGLTYLQNKACAAQIAHHLTLCDAAFVPPLSGRVEMSAYAQKISDKANQFEAWRAGVLIGLLAAYCNERHSGIAYITSVSVLTECGGRGIASRLLEQCIDHVQGAGMRHISLQVARDNAVAIGLYRKHGFKAAGTGSDAGFLCMNLELNASARGISQRTKE